MTDLSTFGGIWNVTIETPIGKLEAAIDITEKDGAIQGKASTKDETVDLIDPVADGNRLTWSQDVTTPMKLTLKFDVTVDGEAMTGTAKAGFLPASKLYGGRASEV
jgi:hypothetical protein